MPGDRLVRTPITSQDLNPAATKGCSWAVMTPAESADSMLDLSDSAIQRRFGGGAPNRGCPMPYGVGLGGRGGPDGTLALSHLAGFLEPADVVPRPDLKGACRLRWLRVRSRHPDPRSETGPVGAARS